MYKSMPRSYRSIKLLILAHGLSVLVNSHIKFSSNKPGFKCAEQLSLTNSPPIYVVEDSVLLLLQICKTRGLLPSDGFTDARGFFESGLTTL